jgi:hypothetical protein
MLIVQYGRMCMDQLSVLVHYKTIEIQWSDYKYTVIVTSVCLKFTVVT